MPGTAALHSVRARPSVSGSLLLLSSSSSSLSSSRSAAAVYERAQSEEPSSRVWLLDPQDVKPHSLNVLQAPYNSPSRNRTLTTKPMDIQRFRAFKRRKMKRGCDVNILALILVLLLWWADI
jgi:hypothetical protein